MTEKQEAILQAALKLFATQGYNSTPTSQIAKEAGVSEGLIFRHYSNKEGLLNAVLQQGENSFKLLFADIVMELNPKTVIRKTINIPFSVPEEEYEFWRLQYKLKWELGHNSQEKIKPLLQALTLAFDQLSYASPALEAELLYFKIDAIGGAILQDALKHKEQMRDFLLSKYKV